MPVLKVIRGALSAAGGILWLIVRFFKRKDAAAPQKKRDEIAKAVLTHDSNKVEEIYQDGMHKRNPPADF